MKKKLALVGAIVAAVAISSLVNAASPPRIALVMKSLSNPFFSEMEKGARAYAAREDLSLEVFGIERETDVARQTAIVEGLVSQKFDAMVIAPADSETLVPVVERALDSGMAVVNIDNPFSREALAECKISVPFVGPDNEQGAWLVGNYIRNKLGGKGRFFIVEGMPGVENADLRKQGFLRALDGHGECEIVAMETGLWHSDEAFNVVSRLLAKHGAVEAVLCANDKMALGALRALDLANLSGKTLVGGYDNIEAVRYEMEQGVVHATVEQHPSLMGELGVKLARDLANGISVAGRIKTPVDLITYESFGKKVVLSVSDLSNPFFQDLVRGAKEASDLLGFDFSVVDAGNSDARQLTDIGELVQAQAPVDVLIVNPTNTDAAIAGIELANRAAIPVITVDRAAAGGKILCHIASDNKSGGRMAAEYIADKLNREGSVVEIEGIPGASASFERGVGFNEALSNYPEIRVVSRRTGWFDREDGALAMQVVLSKGIEFDAVFAHNDNMILGAMDALKKAGVKKDVVLVGFDAIAEARKAVDAGLLDATIAQQPANMGRKAIKCAASFFRGEHVPETIESPLEIIVKRP